MGTERTEPMTGPDLSIFEMGRLVRAARAHTGELRVTLETAENTLERLASGDVDSRLWSESSLVWLRQDAAFRARQEAVAWAEAACVFLWLVLR